MKSLEDLVNEIETKVPYFEKINTNISDGSVGWHIEHTLLTLNLIIDALKKSDASKYKWQFNIKRLYVSTLGKIPRGRVKAPAQVQPVVEYNYETLMQHVQRSKEQINALFNLKPNQFFTHPFLGNFNKKPATRFLKIHTQHHLNIINDIISK